MVLVPEYKCVEIINLNEHQKYGKSSKDLRGSYFIWFLDNLTEEILLLQHSLNDVLVKNLNASIVAPCDRIDPTFRSSPYH